MDWCHQNKIAALVSGLFSFIFFCSGRKWRHGSLLYLWCECCPIFPIRQLHPFKTDFRPFFPVLCTPPPFLQLISSKVPKAEYVPTIIRRDDPSIIPILYVSPGDIHHDTTFPKNVTICLISCVNVLSAVGCSTSCFLSWLTGSKWVELKHRHLIATQTIQRTVWLFVNDPVYLIC